MSKKQTTMNINGRVYDVKTGQVLRVEHSKQTVVNSKSIDGFIKNSAPLDLSKVKPSPTRGGSKANASNLHKAKSRGARLHPAIRKAAQEKARTPQISKFKHATNDREFRAAAVARNAKIVRHAKTSDNEVEQTPVQKPETPDVAPPMPSFAARKRRAEKQAQTQKLQPEEEVDVYENTSWIKRHLVPAFASFAGLALLSGFLVYNSLPNLTMRVAASRAGFDASVPNYQPSGYSFDGPQSYGPGRVVISFSSKTDDRSYVITQRQSNWDSLSLKENFVSERTDNHLTLDENGLTIYLYERDKATWVDDGVWYQLEGDANLSSEQIIKIASSL